MSETNLKTSRAIYNELDNLLSYLIESGIALHVNAISLTPQRVTWHQLRPSDDEFLANRGSPSLATYSGWLEKGAYSAVLLDGALLQVTYDLAGAQVVGHRLAYVPCPFTVDRELLEAMPMADVIYLVAEDRRPHDVVLSTPIRFDFDLLAARRGHPASHLTLNSVDCRIACAGPLRLGHFVDFVFRNFYPELWSNHEFFGAMTRNDWGAPTLTDEEADRMHINWRGSLRRFADVEV